MLEKLQYFSLLVALGMIPSILWLSYYLKKDKHKEPKSVLLEVFLLGGISTIFAIFVEWIFLKLMYIAGFECQKCNEVVPDFIGSANFQIFSTVSFVMFAGLAFIEEFGKYLAVKIRILRDKNFDEPVDAMIYLVTGALGFAAVENIGYIIAADPATVPMILTFRFFTATFLHALASSVVGYFFALSIIHKRSHLLYISIGLALATFLHAVFNIIVTSVERSANSYSYLIALLIFMWFTVSYLFIRIKKMHYNMQSQS